MGEVSGHFERLNTLVDSGLLGQLSAIELKVLIVYMRHADADGLAWPSNKTIAARLGHVKHAYAREARQGLIDRGVLERVVSGGGGASDTSRFRVRIPCPRSAQGDEVTPCPDSEHARNPSMPGIGAAPCPDSGRDPARIPVFAHKEEQHIEQHKEQHSEQTKAPAPSYPPGMQRFWDACPANARGRSSRIEVKAAWLKLKLEPQVEIVLAGLERWKLSEKWTKDGGEYIDGAHRFLKKRLFEETPPTGTRTGKSNGRPGATRPGEYPLTNCEIPIFDALKGRGSSQAGPPNAVPAAVPVRATG